MKHAILICGSVALLLMTGCGEQNETSSDGGIEVSWAIGGSTCGASGIAIVEISIFDSERIYTINSVACELGRVLLPHIPTGTYSLRIDGLQTNSALPVFEGIADEVKVRSGDVTIVPRIYLAEKPGAIDLTWKFYDGNLCSFSGVDTVVVNVWDIHSNRIFQESLPCDPIAASGQAEENVPTRALYDTAKGIVIQGLYAGTYSVQLFGMRQDVDLHPTYWGEQRKVETVHGGLTPVEILLEPCLTTEVCL